MWWSQVVPERWGGCCTPELIQGGSLISREAGAGRIRSKPTAGFRCWEPISSIETLQLNPVPVGAGKSYLLCLYSSTLSTSVQFRQTTVIRSSSVLMLPEVYFSIFKLLRLKTKQNPVTFCSSLSLNCLLRCSLRCPQNWVWPDGKVHPVVFKTHWFLKSAKICIIIHPFIARENRKINHCCTTVPLPCKCYSNSESRTRWAFVAGRETRHK